MRRRRNPFPSRPSNWGSMTKADRRSWNRANWNKDGGGQPATSHRTAHVSGEWSRSDEKLIKEYGLDFWSEVEDPAEGAEGEIFSNWDDNILDRLEELYKADKARFKRLSR